MVVDMTVCLRIIYILQAVLITDADVLAQVTKPGPGALPKHGLPYEMFTKVNMQSVIQNIN